MIRGFIAVAIALSISSSCIREDNGGCGVWLEFVFDHNMEYVDLFATRVGTVDVFLFDEENKYLFARHVSRADLRGGNRMFLGGLPRGNYRILTLGEFSRHFRFTDMEDNDFVAGVTTMEEVKLWLCHKGGVAHNFPDLWFGSAVEIDYRADRSVWPVSLLRVTNRFNITLLGLDQRAAAQSLTVEIVAPEDGVYDYRNCPLTSGRLVYRPGRMSLDGGAANVRINTMRLFEYEKEGCQLVVRDGNTGDELWSHDLIGLLANAKPAKRPDGTALSLQEYLDRRGEWDIVIIYNNLSVNGFVATRVIVNGWIVWEHGVNME